MAGKNNSTIGNYLQGQIWKADSKAHNAPADNFDVMEAAEDAAERNAGPGKFLGLMTKGRQNKTIRDHQVNDLAQVRAQATVKEKVGQVSKIVEDHLRGLGDPRQMSVALREPIALCEHRLDAYDKPPKCANFSH